MPIISKETWDKFTQEEKEKISNMFDNFKEYRINMGDEKQEGVVYAIKELFPAEALQPKPLTYEDVARELFKDKTTFYLNDIGGIQQIPCGRMYDNYKAPVNCTSRKQAEKLLAINKLLNVAKFLNKDWKPDWEKLEEKKWYPSLSDGEIKISYVMRDSSSPVYFRTEELAEQAIQILGEDTGRLALDSHY